MLNNALTAARILIVDDQPSNILLLEGILQEEDYGLSEHHRLPASAAGIS